ncbi:hypothetical protein ABBQ38_010610 [Trebouxia sp. C0009 RCD-2024]
MAGRSSKGKLRGMLSDKVSLLVDATVSKGWQAASSLFEASARSPLSLTDIQVRVWWPPTKDRKKTDFSGMYWPAKVVKQTSEGYEVQYDNGDTETVLSENVSPFNPPFKFGEEGCALQVGLMFYCGP